MKRQLILGLRLEMRIVFKIHIKGRMRVRTGLQVCIGFK